MGTIASALTKNPSCFVYRFSAMKVGDVSETLQGDATPRSVQVFGTFGLTGAVVVEGSNDDGTNWAPLLDVHGNAMNFTAAGIKVFSAPVGLVRARVSAGDGSTSLTALFQS